MYSPSQQRSQVRENLKRQQLSKAIQIAQTIDDPWYKCQALAHCARYADNSEANNLLAQACETASELDSPNRIVSCSAWPFSVICDSHDEAKANT